MAFKKFTVGMGLVIGLLTASAPAQTLTLLHAFAPLGNGTNSDGIFPFGALAASGGVLYGTTFNGGANSNGTVFAVNKDGTSFTNLHVFAIRGGPVHTNADGGWPGGGVIVSGNTLYGTTGLAGPALRGTIFAMKTDGTGFTNLHVFSGGSDGSSTLAGLVLSSNRLYGASQGGGANAYGMLFGMNTDGSAYTNLHSFPGLLNNTNSDGSQPLAALVVAGTNLFGTCWSGGVAGLGSVFRLNTDGSGFTNLHSFTAAVSGTNSDGAMPYAGGLIVGDNVLYGTTRVGGPLGAGVLYRLNTDGSGFTNLHSFSPVNNLTNADGALPYGNLFLSGKVLYGTASVGGTSSNGTVFVMNNDGSGFKVLYNFTGTVNNTNREGATPVSAILSSNTLYLVAHTGGSGGNGALGSLWVSPALSLNLAGGKAVLAWLTNADGFTLQSSSDLSTSSSWSVVGTTPVNTNGQYIITNSLSAGAVFFRLTR